MQLRWNCCGLFCQRSQRDPKGYTFLYHRTVSPNRTNRISKYTSGITFRLLHDNDLGKIKSDGLFGRLPNLVKLDLRRNQITGIEKNAFEGAIMVSDLLLSENKLLEIHNKMFFGLHNLKLLSLSNNHITCVMPGSFDHLTSLHTLYVTINIVVVNVYFHLFLEIWFKILLPAIATWLGSQSGWKIKDLVDLHHVAQLLREWRIFSSKSFRKTTSNA